MFPAKMKFSPSGSNSAGRVRPCQGRCRGFESRLPLQSLAPPQASIRGPLTRVSPDTISSMQGNPKVIAALNEALKEELTAISQYFLHAEMCENWHYHKLGDFI